MNLELKTWSSYKLTSAFKNAPVLAKLFQIHMTLPLVLLTINKYVAKMTDEEWDKCVMEKLGLSSSGEDQIFMMDSGVLKYNSSAIIKLDIIVAFAARRHRDLPIGKILKVTVSPHVHDSACHAKMLLANQAINSNQSTVVFNIRKLLPDKLDQMPEADQKNIFDEYLAALKQDQASAIDNGLVLVSPHGTCNCESAARRTTTSSESTACVVQSSGIHETGSRYDGVVEFPHRLCNRIGDLYLK